MNLCPQCNTELVWKQGVSKKNNKPYRMWKCPNEQCGYVDFVSQAPQGTPQGQPQQKQLPPQKQQPKVDYKSMIMAYAKDITVARIAAGDKNVKPVASTIHTFRNLWKEYQEPFSIKTGKKEEPKPEAPKDVLPGTENFDLGDAPEE